MGPSFSRQDTLPTPLPPSSIRSVSDILKLALMIWDGVCRKMKGNNNYGNSHSTSSDITTTTSTFDDMSLGLDDIIWKRSLNNYQQSKRRCLWRIAH
ncbi:unnamed protein product [Absidia cylindrospora]